MEYQSLEYMTAMSSHLYMDSPPMNYGINGPIDPELEGFSPTPMEPWSPHHIQVPRFLSGHGKIPYSGNHQHETVFASNNVRYSDGTAPLPGVMFPRQGSPSNHPSSICSSALSPHGESDYGLDHLPATPPDDASMFSQYDGPVSQPQHSQHAGLTVPFVKPDEVNIFQDTFQFYENRSPPFSLRGLSMSSNESSSLDLGPTSHPKAAFISEQMCPAEFAQDIKDEIRIPDTDSNTNYHPQESEDEQSLSEDELSRQIKYEDDDEDDEYRPKRQHKRAVSNANRKRQRNSASPQAKRPKLEPNATPAHRTSAKPALQRPRANFPCSECQDIAFKDESGLQKHIKQQHTRPFVCVFGFAGCDSTFASKNEWKRHVSSQHLLLNYWLCQQDACAEISNEAGATKAGLRARRRSNASQSHMQCDDSIPPHGTIFNRKDLYTQHLRRMHVPPNIKKQVKQKKTIPEWEDRIRQLQSDAHKTRCDLPVHMECPAVGCNTHFDGNNAWDERMEHVAKHLEKSDSSVAFGGENDPTLTSWAVRPDVAIVKAIEKGRWMQNYPLKPDKIVRPQVTLGEVDADGEDE